MTRRWSRSGNQGTDSSQLSCNCLRLGFCSHGKPIHQRSEAEPDCCNPFAAFFWREAEESAPAHLMGKDFHSHYSSGADPSPALQIVKGQGRKGGAARDDM